MTQGQNNIPGPEPGAWTSSIQLTTSSKKNKIIPKNSIMYHFFYESALLFDEIPIEGASHLDLHLLININPNSRVTTYVWHHAMTVFSCLQLYCRHQAGWKS